MNRDQNLFKPLALMLAIGFTVAGGVTGCGGSGGGGGGSVTPAISLLAGGVGGDGALDETGAAASFNHPSAVARDSAGNLYVADTRNSTIRKITTAGVVTTLAGTAGTNGSANGIGAAASFRKPHGLATDGTNLYVADKDNHTIRKIVIATGTVTTLAGLTATTGSTDAALGGDARFNSPRGLALNSAGTLLYVADNGNHTIRQITLATTEVTTLAGTAGLSGYVDDTGSVARFNNIFGLTTDSAGNIYASERGNYAIRRITPAGVVTTLAGNPVNGGTNTGPDATNGTGAAASFRFPSGIATDTNGNLYVADKINALIRKVVISTGVVTTVAGTLNPGPSGGDYTLSSADGTGTAASFGVNWWVSNGQPAIGGVAIATDSAGNVYVPDSGSHSIRKITPAGVVTTFAGTSRVFGSTDATGAAARFKQTKGIAVDSAGNTFVSDGQNNTIRKITPSGVVTTFAGTAGITGATDATGAAASFNRPLGLAIDSTDNIYVADKGNNSVRKITPTGVVTTVNTVGMATGFNRPHDLAIDSTGNVYVSNIGDGTIKKIDPLGVVTNFATGFSQPTGLAIDSADNVYVAAVGTHTISKITPLGVVTVLAGSGAVGSADGTGAAASFNKPHGMAIDSNGNLYVADRRNNTIRKITPAGVVTTVAGVASTNNANSGADTRSFKAGALPGYLPAPRFVALKGNTLYVTAKNGVIKVKLP